MTCYRLIKKSSGFKIEPRGTPHVIDGLSEYVFSILITNFLFEWYDEHRLIVLSVKPKNSIFFN